MSVLDPRTWMPDGMSLADKDTLTAAYPDDPHRAAALAWEAWAAHLGGTGTTEGAGLGATSVSTGAQSVAYGDGYGGGATGEALRRAAWHRSRSRVRSVDLGPQYGLLEGDPEDSGVIATYRAGTR